jgi:hypothetical protein
MTVSWSRQSFVIPFVFGKSRHDMLLSEGYVSWGHCKRHSALGRRFRYGTQKQLCVCATEWRLVLRRCVSVPLTEVLWRAAVCLRHWVNYCAGPTARTDRLKICTLNRRDWLSVVQWLVLGLKGLVCAVGRLRYCRRTQNNLQHRRPPPPPPPPPFHGCAGFVLLTRTLCVVCWPGYRQTDRQTDRHCAYCSAHITHSLISQKFCRPTKGSEPTG